MNSIVKSMIICLICTLVIEIIFAVILRVRDKKDLLNIALVNILTNPLVVSISLYIHIYYGNYYYRISMIILELLVLFIEGFIYKRVLKKQINPYVLSLILNASSYGLGLIINRFM